MIRLIAGVLTALLVSPVLAATPTAADAPPAPGLHFVTDVIPLRNARVGTDFHASIGGLALGGDDPVFRKTGGAGWVTVSSDGMVTGRPPSGAAGTATVQVEVRDSGGVDTATVRIPVRSAGAALVPGLKVLSFNLWYGGTNVDDGREKQLRILLDNNVDAVGLQEHMGTSAQDLAAALGWYYHPGDSRVAIISRYPITERQVVDSPIPCCVPGGEDFSENVGISARIQVDDRGAGKYVELWDTHHPAELYGPYAMCFGGWPQSLLIAQEALRALVMKLLLNGMAADLGNAETTPVILTGDFNAPSHLDYTPATAEQHCGYERMAWPSSQMAARHGLTDTFRVANPDPAAVPGNTWSPVTPIFGGDGLLWDAHAGQPEPQDRIDFVYEAGSLEVLDSIVVDVGEPVPADHPDARDNEWPSDHAAVLTTFRLS